MTESQMNVVRADLGEVESAEVLAMGDLHYGDKHQDRAAIQAAVKWAQEKPNRYLTIAGDLFNADLRQATAVTLYLLRSVNLRLRPKLLAELPASTASPEEEDGTDHRHRGRRPPALLLRLRDRRTARIPCRRQRLHGDHR